MSTSGGGTLNAIAYVLVVVLAVRVAPRRSLSKSAIRLWLTVAVPSVIGLMSSGFYDALYRDPSRITDGGQWWRLLTAVVVQDGGTVGTVANLVFLGMVVSVAFPLWGSIRAVLLFVGGAVLFNLLATFVWDAPGAGNSAATFFLAAATVALVAYRRRSQLALMCAAVELTLGVALAVSGDAHGVVVIAGLIVGALMAALWPPRTNSLKPAD